MKYLEQRINWCYGRILIPAHLLIIIALSIYANCAAISYSSSSLIMNIIRKLNTLAYSVMSFCYILFLGYFADTFSKQFKAVVKKWKLQSRAIYYKKAFHSIPPLHLRIGEFCKVSRHTSMMILIYILKYTGMVLIKILKDKKVNMQYT